MKSDVVDQNKFSVEDANVFDNRLRKTQEKLMKLKRFQKEQQEALNDPSTIRPLLRS